MGETEILAEYIAKAKYENLPVEVVAHAKKTIMDCISSGLGGRKTQDADMIIDIVREMGGKPQATIFGEKIKVSCMQAAQANRVLTHVLDYDDTYEPIGHTSSPLVSTALAMGEYVNASGKDVINALVLGYEVATHTREAVAPSEKAMSTFEGVDCAYAFAVTTVAGKLMGLNAQQMADAYGLTGFVRTWRVIHMAKDGPARWMKITGGDFTFPVINSVFLAKKGMLGNRNILDQDMGYERSLGSDQYDAGKLIAGLGKKYNMLSISFKYFLGCRHANATQEAVATLAAENNIKADDVDEVIIKVKDINGFNFAFYEPKFMARANFSLPYLLTMILVREPMGPNWYTEDKLNSPKIREFQHKVKYEEDRTAKESPSAVEIKTVDGKSFKKEVGIPKGERENPFTRQDHVDKLTNMARVLGMKQSQIDELIKTFDRLEELDSISQLTHLLVCA